MTREEFEDWLNLHGSEAVDNIEVDDATHAQWLKMYAVSLSNLLQEQQEEEEDEEDEDEEFEPEDEG